MHRNGAFITDAVIVWKDLLCHARNLGQNVARAFLHLLVFVCVLTSFYLYVMLLNDGYRGGSGRFRQFCKNVGSKRKPCFIHVQVDSLIHTPVALKYVQDMSKYQLCSTSL